MKLLSSPILSLLAELRERWPRRHVLAVIRRHERDSLREIVEGLRLLRAAEERLGCAGGFHVMEGYHGLDRCSLCGHLRDRALRMSGEDMMPIEDGNAPSEAAP